MSHFLAYLAGLFSGVALVVYMLIRSHRAFTEMFNKAPKGK